MFTNRQQAWLFGSAIVLAIAIWLGWALFGFKLIGLLVAQQGTVDKAGQWGDTFGGLNAIFGAVGTCLVLATLMAQRQSLREQQVDSHKERFDTTFFELLKLMRELSKVQHGNSNKLVTAVALNQMNNIANHAREISNDAELSARVLETYQAFVHEGLEYHLSPYFRIVYTILRRIRDDKVLSETEKVDYANLLRSQLNSVEVALAGYNGLTPQSNNFLDLLVQFRMLKYLPQNIHRDVLVRLYSSDAFAARADASSAD
ncbi:putative phage abortive infection protein [Tardiphaga sp. 215_C5_N2_1]|uniref:putative phage abortive infection protein n=1 Tax=Tardiphaga sp. 215_C5_N2_1 TaxID=3240774 RepID=UPI003F8CDF38